MIILACDHNGFELKEKIKAFFNSENITTIDVGTYSDDRVDYPDFALAGVERVLESPSNVGIFICGTGIGMSIAANKVKGLMCAKISNKEEARLAKEHNRANVIALSGNLTKEEALDMIYEFLNAKEIDEEKYTRRINQIRKYENGD